MLDCACGFGPRYELICFSPAWHQAHQDHHLAVYPDVDPVTRANLQEAIDRAEREAVLPGQS